MKNTFKILLIGATIIASATAINKHSSIHKLENELEFRLKENKKLTNKLTHTSKNLITSNQKNKKLSKRVVNEINKIITLKDSVNNLDENLKSDQKKLADNLSQTKKLSREKRRLARVIQKNKQLEKQDCGQLKKSISKINISDIQTTLMRKKFNGSFVKTFNSKKVDAFKTHFKILDNQVTKAGKKKVNIKVFNSENNAITFNDVSVINYNNENSEVTSIIEVKRGEIESGTYNIIAYIDGKEVNSSLAYVK